MDVAAQLNAALTGRYTIEREIGAGGMATVYLARDVRHNRRVALKVLKPELGLVLGGDRFLTEIETTANLQHPHLLPLFDSGTVAGLLFYVMPYVEGETLRQRLDRERQLAVDEAVRIAVAVASALDYAHRHGIIHRDLKPENILLHDGQPMVADFGIALAVSKAGGNRITQTGLSLGTPQYMSPEQATGDRQLDGRTDIYSLAAILYEMLSGDPPHTGSSAQVVIAKVLTDRPMNIRAHRPSVPVHVDAAVQVALSKLAADRFASAAEFADVLRGTRPLPTHTAAIETAHARPRLGSGAWVPWAIAAAALGLAGWLLQWREPVQAAVPAEFEMALPASAQVRGPGGIGTTLAISNDGTKIVYKHTEAGELYLRSMDSREPRPVRGTDNAHDPTFSPDGNWILFSSAGTLMKVAANGGTPFMVVDSGTSGSWSNRKEIVFARGPTLWRVSADGGAATMLATPNAEHGHVRYGRPHVLPGGKAALFTLWKRSDILANAQLGIVTLSNGKIRELNLPGAHFRYAPSGHVIFGREGGTVFAAPFSLRKLELTGAAVPLIENVVVRGNGATDVAIADNGTIAYVRGLFVFPYSHLVAIDRKAGIRVLTPDSGFFSSPRISPDGRTIALERRGSVSLSNDPDIWVVDVPSGGLTRVSNNGHGVRPVWTRDGQRIAYVRSDSQSVEWQAWDRTAPPEILIPGQNIAELTLGPNPGYVVVRVGSGNQRDLAIAHWDSLPNLRPLLTTPYNEAAPALSPDGKLLAYVSDENGRWEVYVQPIPGPGARIIVSAGGGLEPVWAADSRTLFYRSSSHMHSAKLSDQSKLAVASRDTLFKEFAGARSVTTTLAISLRAVSRNAQYDVFPNGNEFVMLRDRRRDTGDEISARLIVLINWNQELKRRSPVR